MERGLNEVQSQALGVQQNTAYAVYDNSHPAPEAPNAILYQKDYNVSRFTDES